MTTESISFTSVLDKYFLYLEALSQYYTLEKEDQKIIEPYIRHLKQTWQEELELIKAKLEDQVNGQTITA